MPAKTNPIAKLALADATVFTGQAFGYLAGPPITGEVVFNTSLTGYQEIITDPSYTGQIVTMTYPQIGNYGINTLDAESTRPQVAGFIIKELSPRPSNYRSELPLEQWLNHHKIPGIAGIDTRALTRKLRISGSMNGVISTTDLDDSRLIALAQSAPSMAGLNLAQVVSPTSRSDWQGDLGAWQPLQGIPPKPASLLRVVAIDCGAKHNILRNLVDRGCQVIVVPHDISAADILALKPDGLFVSNGPGDPEPVTATINALAALDGKVPTFGICLGHQLLAKAMGAATFKLKFGHRGGNQPVQNLATGKVEITSQNHGFAVDPDSLRAVGGEPTHINLNDRTLEGFRHPDKPIFAVQYHPEASPGPHDASYLFDCFIEMMKTGTSPTAQQMDDAQQRRSQLART